MELSRLWALAGTVLWSARIVHGTLPIPVLHFENFIVEDDFTTITCTLPYSEYPDAELAIKMGNVSLPGCRQNQGSYPNVTCRLEVTRQMHEREFTCEARLRSRSQPARMMLQTDPEFTDCPEKVVWVEGQETSFHCKATGYPLPVVTCQRNSKVYKDGKTFTAEKEMSGTYSCRANNRDVVHRSVAVSVEYKPKILNIDVQPSFHGEGDNVMLTCKADGLPDPTYSWSVPSSDVTFSPDNQTITVQSLQKSHLGSYKCTAHNKHGTATMESKLDLAVKPKILNITAQPSTQVLEGENVTLTCEASGFPPPVFAWDTPNPNVDYSQDRRTVSIWGVKKNDAGEYRCMAENAHGGDTQVQQLTLAVKAKVVHIKVQPSASVEEGANVTLTCVADGVPPPKLSWVPATPDVQYSSGNVINIWGATKMHNGLYQCKAENKYGVDTRSEKITVKVSAKDSRGNRGERREPIFATILATLISTSLFYYLC